MSFLQLMHLSEPVGVPEGAVGRALALVEVVLLLPTFVGSNVGAGELLMAAETSLRTFGARGGDFLFSFFFARSACWRNESQHLLKWATRSLAVNITIYLKHMPHRGSSALIRGLG